MVKTVVSFSGFERLIDLLHHWPHISSVGIPVLLSLFFLHLTQTATFATFPFGSHRTIFVLLMLLHLTVLTTLCLPNFCFLHFLLLTSDCTLFLNRLYLKRPLNERKGQKILSFFWTQHSRAPIHSTSLKHQVKQYRDRNKGDAHSSVSAIIFLGPTAGLMFSEGPLLFSWQLGASSEVPGFSECWGRSPGEAELIGFSSNLPQAALLAWLPLNWITVMLFKSSSDYSGTSGDPQERSAYSCWTAPRLSNINTTMAGNLSKERSYLITPLIFVSLIHVTDLPEAVKRSTCSNQDQDHDERAPSAWHTCLLPPCPFSHLFKLSPMAAEILMDIQQNWFPTHLRRKKPSAPPVVGLVYQVGTERLTPTPGRTAGKEGLLIFTATTAKAQPKARKMSCKGWGFQLSKRLLHSQQHIPHWMAT